MSSRHCRSVEGVPPLPVAEGVVALPSESRSVPLPVSLPSSDGNTSLAGLPCCIMFKFQLQIATGAVPQPAAP